MWLYLLHYNLRLYTHWLLLENPLQRMKEKDKDTEPYQIKVGLRVVKFDKYFDCDSKIPDEIIRGTDVTIVYSIVGIMVLLLVIVAVAFLVAKRKKAPGYKQLV